MEDMKIEKREQALDSVTKDPYRIVKGNPLIEARFELTPTQMKLFIYMLSLLDISKESFVPLTITVKDFQKFTGVEGGSLYSHLQQEVKKMIDKKVYYKDDRIELDSHLISGYVYFKKEGYFILEFPNLLKPFLLQLKENFTVLDIRNILRLDSSYAMRFYEICKEKEKIGTFEFEVDKLKRMFNIEHKYKNYFDFKMKVVVQAQNELMKNSELYFEFSEIKQGKKVVKLRFVVKKNKLEELDDMPLVDQISASFKELPNPLPLIAQSIEIEANQTLNLIFEQVKDWSISQQTVREWLEQFAVEQIQLAIDHVKKELLAGKTFKNIGGYLTTLVKSPDLMQAQQQEIKRKEEAKRIQVAKKAEAQIKKEQQLKKDELLEEYTNAKRIEANQILTQNPQLYTSILGRISGNLLGSMQYDSYIKFCGGQISLDTFLNYFNLGTGFYGIVMNILEADYPVFGYIKDEYHEKAKAIGLRLSY
ncbi:MAG: replication initiation protein [Flectobacillus sp.]|uniref:replication initiation protein n=1 Tax=Flectobacillus sp. TaxID=50419 RepID=UPI003B99E904